MKHNMVIYLNSSMKKLFPFITFACLTSFAATSGLPVFAGRCNDHWKKTTELKCDKDDTECQRQKTEKLNSKETVRS